jgi:ribonuclease P/MRP protein subunit RPP40
MKYRRLRGDMIMVYKLLSRIYDSNIACHLNEPTNFVTRGHSNRLFKLHSRYDLRRYFFGNRLISLWNSLPENVVDSNSLLIFENRQDNFWCNQACYFFFTVDVTGTGSQSQKSVDVST